MKTCLVILQTSTTNPELKNNADDLFELIIEPALEKFDYQVTRMSHDTTDNLMTEEIVDRVQSSDLCIIDVSGTSPGIFYQFGRRHQTGMPFILMLPKNQKFSFDVAGTRIVYYDFSDARKIKDCMVSLRGAIKEFEEYGFQSNPKASMEDIVSTLTRIEKKIDALNISKSVDQEPVQSATSSGSPALIFYDALKKNDFPAAVNALKRFMQISPDVNLHLDMASMLVESYEPTAVPIVRSILDNNFDQLQPSKLSIALHGLYTFYVGALAIEKESGYLVEQTTRALEKSPISDKDKAALYNVLASVSYSLKDDERSLKFQEYTIELNPTEPAYYYNIATLYRELKMEDELLKSLNSLVTIYKSKDPGKEKINFKYLDWARGIYSDRGETTAVKEIDQIIAKSKMYPENAVVDY